MVENSNIHFMNEFIVDKLRKLPLEKTKTLTESGLIDFLHNYIDRRDQNLQEEIGRASCRERV